MNNKMSEVYRRRGELQARIAAERVQVAELGARWEAPLALADQGLAVVRFLRSNPALVIGMAALLVVRRRGVVGLLRGGWRVWKGYRFISAFSAKLASRL